MRAVARAHGGEVRVRSSPGKGSEFELVLPIAAPPPGPPGGLAPGERILAGQDGMPEGDRAMTARVEEL